VPSRGRSGAAGHLAQRESVLCGERAPRAELAGHRFFFGDAGGVASRLAQEWRERKAGGTWKANFEDRADLAPDERIERTVFVRAPRSIAYGEVAKVIDSIKGAGAQPVGLQTDELPN